MNQAVNLKLMQMILAQSRAPTQRTEPTQGSGEFKKILYNATKQAAPKTAETTEAATGTVVESTVETPSETATEAVTETDSESSKEIPDEVAQQLAMAQAVHQPETITWETIETDEKVSTEAVAAITVKAPETQAKAAPDVAYDEQVDDIPEEEAPKQKETTPKTQVSAERPDYPIETKPEATQTERPEVKQEKDSATIKADTVAETAAPPEQSAEKQALVTEKEEPRSEKVDSAKDTRTQETRVTETTAKTTPVNETPANEANATENTVAHAKQPPRTETTPVSKEVERPEAAQKPISGQSEEIKVEVKTAVSETTPTSSTDVTTQSQPADRFSAMVQEASKQLETGQITAEPVEEDTEPVLEVEADIQPLETPKSSEPAVTKLPEPEILKQQPGKHIIISNEAPAREARRAEPQRIQRVQRQAGKDDAPSYEAISAAIGKLDSNKTAPVKEIETPDAPVMAREVPQAEQIKTAITRRLTEDGAQERIEFSMELQPKELGKVEIRMALEGGKLAVEIIAASPKAENLLRAQLDNLTASLKASGTQELSSVQVVSSSSEASGHLGSAFNMNYQNPGAQQQQTGHGGARARHQMATEQEQPVDIPEIEAPVRLLNYAI